jgi:hypothetical protein
MRLPPLTAMQDELPGTFLGCLKVIPTVTRALIGVTVSTSEVRHGQNEQL